MSAPHFRNLLEAVAAGGLGLALNATAEQIRSAILDPASYVTDGWRLPGLGSVRIRANARSSVAMQQRVDAAWEFAPHNLVLNSDTLGTQSVSTIVGAQYTLSIVGTGSVALTGAATGTLAGTGASNRVATTVTATTTTLTLTVTGSVTTAALCLGAAMVAYVPTTAAAVYGPAIDWLTGIGAYGLRGFESRTNSVRNSACVGAASGSPGTQPTNWTFDAAGMTRTITAGVTLLGLPAVDIRFSGTSSTGYITIYPDDYVGGAGVSQAWAFSAIAALSAGSIGSALVTPYMADYSGASFLRQRVLAAGAALPAGGARFSGSGTTGASTNGVRGYLVIDVLSTVSATDFTIRIACPQLELGAFATSPILTYGAAATRAADAANATNLSAGGAGTLIADFITVATSGVRGIASLNTGTASNRIDVRGNGDSIITVGGFLQASMTGTAATANVLQRAGVAYGVDDAAASLGGAVPVLSNPPNIPVTDRLTLGDIDGGATAPLNGWITRVRFGTRRFSDAELRALTA